MTATMTATSHVLKIAIAGLGTVGQGTLSVLHRNQAEITRRTGIQLEVAYVASRNHAKTQTIVDAIFGNDDVLNAQNATLQRKPMVLENVLDLVHTDVDVVIELMGSMDAAHALVLKAIEHKKHIVTANKALLAHHGDAIFEKAQLAGVMVAFESSVAGGIPIIKMLREGLGANHIQWIAGIINGTCNFILSKMSQEGLDFATALKQAQALGYAEADPTFDVQGIDAAHKLSILSSLAFGTPIQFNQAHIEGITQITDVDMRYAKELGYTIKLLGITELMDAAEVSLRVHPCLIPQQHMLANVDHAMNAVMVCADAAGKSLYYGKGAGAEPTASAVIADLIDIARSTEQHQRHRVPYAAFQQQAQHPLPIMHIDKTHTSYYLRLRMLDEAGMLAGVTGLLATAGISIDVLLQKNHIDHDYVDVVILTHRTRESMIKQVIADLSRQNMLAQPHDDKAQMAASKIKITELHLIRVERLD